MGPEKNIWYRYESDILYRLYSNTTDVIERKQTLLPE